MKRCIFNFSNRGHLQHSMSNRPTKRRLDKIESELGQPSNKKQRVEQHTASSNDEENVKNNDDNANIDEETEFKNGFIPHTEIQKLILLTKDYYHSNLSSYLSEFAVNDIVDYLTPTLEMLYVQLCDTFGKTPSDTTICHNGKWETPMDKY
eukprot:501299_1